MGKARTILYEPVDKFAGVAWDLSDLSVWNIRKKDRNCY